MTTRPRKDEPQWDIFLMYPSELREKAGFLYRRFVEAGLTVCMDIEVLKPGDHWPGLFPDFVKRSSHYVSLLGQPTSASVYQRDEIMLALQEVRSDDRRRFITVRVDDVEPVYGTSIFTSIDALRHRHE